MSTPAPAPAKVCHVCHKDVSNAKRVKDPAGHYYCQACYDKAAHAAPVGAARGSSAARAPHVPGAQPMSVKVTTPPPEPRNHILDFDDPAPATKPRVVAPAPAPVGSKLPEFCPHCGMKVVGGRKLCVKCRRDITAPPKKYDSGGGGSEAIAGMISRLIKLAIWIVVIGFIAFAGYGVKMLLFTKIVPFEEYPTARAAVVNQFLGFVEKGGDKNYEEALKLVSFRIRHGTNNANEDIFWKTAFGRMHDEFVKRYGEGWMAKAKIKGGGEDLDDGVNSYYQVIFGKEAWGIGVQVQITGEKEFMDSAGHKDQRYPDNGPWHFGISELAQFPTHPTTEIKEIGEPSRVWEEEKDQ